MKYKMIADVFERSVEVKYNMNRMYFDAPNIEIKLTEYLTRCLAESLDPDLKGKKAEGYIKSLKLGRFGDFSKSIILTSTAQVINGILIAVPKDGIYNITTLGVSIDDRGKGIGQMLLGSLMDVLAVEKVNSVTLDVHSLNTPAIKLYSNFGFRLKISNEKKISRGYVVAIS